MFYLQMSMTRDSFQYRGKMDIQNELRLKYEAANFITDFFSPSID